MLEAEELGFTLTCREYYDILRKDVADKAQPNTVGARLVELKEASFVYRTPVRIEDGEG